MSGFEAVLFDLDDTLCRHEQSEETLYRGAFEAAGVEPFGAPSDLWTALSGPPPADGQEAYLREGFDRVAAQYGEESVDTGALARGFLDAVDYTAVSLRPGAAAALERARELGRVALVTNGPERRQTTKLAALDLQEAFDVRVFSDDVPRRKPHSDPFDRALARLDVEAEATLHVGNSLEHDVAGAQDAGLRAAWCPVAADADPGDHSPDYVLESLSDLRDVLDAPRRAP
ncbi:HAD family hydrolase [Halopelagius longus]|uniref:HAD family hydrolase n=1 Tax=Halopelagius longus TaxID=1236180 RepID=A0A1H0YCK3_9EURY|nr:HAD family hydrolase [Halopelagius longus]RDI72406.1 HAD family hydrolase [Halopelagius longus]SDQ12721.1 putative hydrolase of the HAD superfamily [Halopelagius longus]